jgi:hypothetical protein
VRQAQSSMTSTRGLRSRFVVQNEPVESAVEVAVGWAGGASTPERPEPRLGLRLIYPARWDARKSAPCANRVLIGTPLRQSSQSAAGQLGICPSTSQT